MSNVKKMIESYTNTDNGVLVDAVLASVRVNVNAEIADELVAAIKDDRHLSQIILKHRGALGRLSEYLGSRVTAVRLIAFGAQAGLWTIQSAVELLKQSPEKAKQMAANGFLYVKPTHLLTEKA